MPTGKNMGDNSPNPVQSVIERRAKDATEEKFALRLATEDQRNGYEVGYFDALTALSPPEPDYCGIVRVDPADFAPEPDFSGPFGWSEEPEAEMAGLVERLRESAQHFADDEWKLLHETADTITRLSAEIEQLKRTMEGDNLRAKRTSI